MQYFFLLILVLQISHGNCRQKNILFLVADDMRPNLGAYEEANSEIFGQPPMYTPNLDALASKSLVFEKAYDAQALCSPRWEISGFSLLSFCQNERFLSFLSLYIFEESVFIFQFLNAKLCQTNHNCEFHHQKIEK